MDADLLSTVEASDRSGGFTFVELVMALTILLVVVLGSALTSARLLHATADAEVEAKALQALEDRVSTVRMESNYEELEERYAGVESGLAGLPAFKRKTVVSHVATVYPGAGMLDYKAIDVSVSGPFLASPLTRRLVISAP